MKKIKVFGLILGLVGIGLGSLFIWKCQAQPLVWEQDVKSLFHVIAEDMKTERTISWQTEKEEESSQLELREKGKAESFLVEVAQEKIPTYQEGKNWIHTANISGLKAGQEYEYRVLLGDRASKWRNFKTEPESADSFKVLIFGDSQSVDYGVWKETAEVAFQRNPESAFFISMGDLVDNGQDDWQWRVWLEGGKNLFAEMPIAPITGNHEMYNLDWKPAKPEIFLSLFQVPKNGPAGMEGYTYSYDYGDVHFVVLNTQLTELAEWYPDLLEKQAEWLEADLEKSQKKWTVVMMHRSLWRFPFDGPLDKIGQAFMPVFDRHEVDVVFIGHVHSYSRTKPIRRGEIDPAGTVYIATGRSGDRVWERSPKKPVDEVFYNPIDQPNYLTFTGSKEKLTVKNFRQDGTLIDETEIRK